MYILMRCSSTCYRDGSRQGSRSGISQVHLHAPPTIDSLPTDLGREGSEARSVTLYFPRGFCKLTRVRCKHSSDGLQHCTGCSPCCRPWDQCSYGKCITFVLF
jgi:hypothetical protein